MTLQQIAEQCANQASQMPQIVGEILDAHIENLKRQGAPEMHIEAFLCMCRDEFKKKNVSCKLFG